MAFSRRESALVATSAALVFSRVFGLSLVLPGFVHYARGLPGATDLLVGVAFGAYGLTLALMQLPMGWLSDHIGRKPVLLLGGLLFVAGSAGAALAPSVPFLVAARLVQGLGAVSSVAMAMVGETVHERRRTMAMALVGIPAGLGFFLGILVAAELEGVLTVAQLFWVSGAMALIATLPVPWLRVGRVEVSLAVLRTSRAVLSLAAAGFVLNYGLTTVLFFLSDAGRAGVELRWPLLFALAVMALVSRQVDKRGLTWQPVAAGLVVLGAAGLATIAGSSWMVWAAAFFAAHATLSAVLPSQVSRISGAAGGRGHGIQNVVAYSGTFLAGTVAGVLSKWAFAAGAVLAILAAVVAAVASWRLWQDSSGTHPHSLGSEEG